MIKKDIAVTAVELLEKYYPEAKCSLEYSDPFQLLIATRLSAQCTDNRVNIVTPDLFRAFPNAEAFANADVKAVEELIKTCGLYKTKAKDLVGIGKGIVNNFGGRVPGSIDELITLPGVGRKTANLICGDIFGLPAVVTDTHLIRLSNRLGIVKTKEPIKVEKELIKLLPPKKSNGFCHRAVMLGREICTARKAHCENCPLKEICRKVI